MKFRIAAYTDSAGKTNPQAPRNGNEDNMFINADLSDRDRQVMFSLDNEENLSNGGCLLVVADGMGGMNAGEVASEIAIEVVKNAFDPETLPQSVLASDKTREQFMEDVVLKADEAVKKHASEHSECEGMGSTIILAWVHDQHLSVTWCGDSRCYIYRDGLGLKQISKDHSYVQSLIDDGKITEEQAFDHPLGNIITRSLGDPSKKAKADSITVPLCKGDIILVNSDGLSGVLRDSEMEQIIRDNRETMGKCREALFDAAQAADWYDNVTGILCEITDGASPSMQISPEINSSGKHIMVKKSTLYAVIAGVVLIMAVIIGMMYFANRKGLRPVQTDTVEVIQNCSSAADTAEVDLQRKDEVALDSETAPAALESKTDEATNIVSEIAVSIETSQRVPKGLSKAPKDTLSDPLENANAEEEAATE